MTVVPDVLGVLIILLLVDLEFVFLFFSNLIGNIIPVVSWFKIKIEEFRGAFLIFKSHRK